MPELWPFVPSGVDEILSFNTSVLKKRDSEMRVSRQGAQQVLRYVYRQTPTVAAKTEWLFRSAPVGEWYVPIWHEMTRSGDVSSGAGTLTVDTDAEYVAGGYAFIYGGVNAYEIAQITTVGSGSLTLTGTVSASYTAPLIMPVKTGRFVQAPKRTQLYPVCDIECVFRMVSDPDLSDNPFSQVAGFDAVTDSISAGVPFDGAISADVTVTQTGFGVFDVVIGEEYNRRTATIEFVDTTPATRWRRRGWLHAVRGRDRAFWLSSQQADLILTASIGASDTSITVSEVAADDSDLVGRVLFIKENGTEVVREITAAATAAGVHTLDISATGQAFTADAQVSIGILYRMDTDEVDISHTFAGDRFISRVRVPAVEVAA